ncbi:MAG TPA: xanthine dehydrogenase family protein molybdopterin-binding subunit [Burkholderiales bacterium]|nr:xanthine dehydrogenase family protein molybdopterin-binding subunit [Burkholderiales bacterium]
MHNEAGKGVGASLRRKEDARFLTGRGQFVGDIRRPAMLEVAFVRAPVAHARINRIEKPAGLEDRVWTMQDLAGVKPIRAISGLAGFKPSDLWPLAKDKVRHVGEAVAMCVGATRGEAEDVAARVIVDYAELPAVVDMIDARLKPPALVHDEWGDNVFLETLNDADLAQVRASAAICVRRHIRTARQAMSPLEGRGVLCEWLERTGQLEMYSSAQMPHINRAGLSECLGLDQASIRVISPDVGGGFGYKGILLVEEICLAWLARSLRLPVRWLEDRREQLTANANCREHDYDIVLYADREGRLLAIDCEATVDSGAYSLYPFSACLEAAQVASILPGPYKMERYRCHTWSVATNKPGILPYRGVARTGVCFALEVALDAVAREAGREPYEVRLANLVQPHEMPYDNITKKHFDSGDYPEAVRRAVAALDVPKWRARQKEANGDARRIGVGVAVYCEQAAHGTSVYYGWGIPMVPGHEQCFARLSPDGMLELRIGAHSHGQSLETTLAQVAHETLGIDPANVRLIHGDTAQTPYSTGTWGSRCMVMSGGAVATACNEIGRRVKHIAGHLLGASPEDMQLKNGEVGIERSDKRMTLAEVAHTWYRQPQLLPPDVHTEGLETIGSYKARVDTGTFSYACHAVALAVDTEIGQVEILDYVVAEDGGKLINPMVVDGQIYGGAAQGIGTALYEEMPYDAAGQPLASTLADYMLPGATEVPALRILHMETPSPYTEFGQKGIGEGGAIAPPAAIVNAVNDALHALGVELTETPVTPRRVLAALAAAKSRNAR